MPRLLPHPDLDWTDAGAPHARQHGDVYFSAQDGLAETRTVFLRGCDLPEAWQGRASFSVAETGFGTGLNFLALWQLWRARRPAPDAQLTFVSFEGYPLRQEDARRALGAWPELGELADRLTARWPGPVRGVRSIDFPEDGVRLVLHLGDIRETLPQSTFSADAWFLDGFSPAKNEDMWSEWIYPLIAARSAQGARLGTFTVAGAVRRGLSGTGFEVSRAEGHGRKRERLEARLVTPRPAPADTFGLRSPSAAPSRVAILGAGIAGAALAKALTRRGISVEIFDPAPGPASGASGNPLALLMPRLDAGDTAEAGLLLDAYLAAREAYGGLPDAAYTDVLQSPQSAAEVARFEKLLADPPLPLDDLEAVRGGGLLHKRALILRPAALVARLLEGAACRFGAAPEVSLAHRSVNGQVYDTIVLANGMQAAALSPGLPLEARLGQVDFVDTSAMVTPTALVSGSYALALGTHRLWGATFEPSGADFAPGGTPDARAENRAGVARLSPYWVREALDGEIRSRASLRATTPDRLPLIGAVPDHAAALETFAPMKKGRSVDADAPLMEGVYVAGGFGARGFTWAPWAAEILAARLAGSPPPASLPALRAVSPMRFVFRTLKRSR
ncbi:FAD-dependent 5-carboxymethylaminomethyl-2-thiouridine(34) oxidoreductase MnmC [Hyphomonas sp.]|uniref:FAD-dependent 5-carboxymethylaminomethyl-2-thiouridine(34) oxidoreductase MnmC n=1 Tax=Hyphomonas sp. TaxID=87 RepID=UPI0025BF4A76|nr:FAD-dependent 5-carboxymethylaminomethyl-2-thiouridine(34) oxidoreductase MnmC [Hyphomonas sp.]